MLQSSIKVSFLFQIPKLFQWLIAGGVFLAVWIALVFEYVDLELSDSTKDLVLFVSLILIINFRASDTENDPCVHYILP